MIKNIPLIWQKSLFTLMTASAVLSLYFENLSQIGGKFFFVTLLFLLVIAILQGKRSIGKAEKVWMVISATYAIVLVLSFLLRPPFMYDGIWRLSAPGFILLLLGWFWVASRLELGDWVIKSVAYSSIFFAIIFFILEMKLLGGWSANYRYGAVLSDVGRTGFFLPLTTALLAFLFLATKSKIHLTFFIISLVLSSLVFARTSLVMVSLPLIFLAAYLLFGNLDVKRSYKTWTGILILLIMSVILLVSKDRIIEAVNDYQLAVQQGNFNSSMGLRFVMLDTGLGIVKENFWLGVGQNQYKIILAEHAYKSEYSDSVKSAITGFTHLHNQFLMDLVLSGILGLLSLLLFIGYPIWLFIKVFKAGNKLAAVYGLGFMAGFWFILFFGAIFTYTYTTILYVLTVGSIIHFYLPKLKGSKHA